MSIMSTSTQLALAVAMTLPVTEGTDDDVIIFSNVDNYASEEEDNLGEEEKKLLEVRTELTERHNNESAEDFLMTREAVVRFL